MSTILELLQAPYNLLYSVLIIVAIGIWLITIFGFFSLSLLDGVFDFAFDADFDHDIDGSAVGGIASILSFVGVGKIPVSLIVTILMVIFGGLGVTCNHYLISFGLVPINWLWLAVVATGIICFVVSLYVTAFIVKPLYPLFEDYGVVANSESLVGQIASITSGKATGVFGQASLRLEGGESAEITVRALPNTEMQYGDRALIVDFDEERNIYFVEPYLDDLPEK